MLVLDKGLWWSPSVTPNYEKEKITNLNGNSSLTFFAHFLNIQATNIVSKRQHSFEWDIFLFKSKSVLCASCRIICKSGSQFTWRIRTVNGRSIFPWRCGMESMSLQYGTDHTILTSSSSSSNRLCLHRLTFHYVNVDFLKCESGAIRNRFKRLRSTHSERKRKPFRFKRIELFRLVSLQKMLWSPFRKGNHIAIGFRIIFRFSGIWGATPRQGGGRSNSIWVNLCSLRVKALFSSVVRTWSVMKECRMYVKCVSCRDSDSRSASVLEPVGVNERMWWIPPQVTRRFSKVCFLFFVLFFLFLVNVETVSVQPPSTSVRTKTLHYDIYCLAWQLCE